MLAFNHLFMGRGYRGSFAWGWKVLLAWSIAATTYEIVTETPGGISIVNNMMSLGTLTLITVNIVTGHMKTRDTGSVLQNATAAMVVATLHDVLAAAGVIAGLEIRLMQFGLLIVLLAMVYGLLVRAKTNNEALATMESELRTAESIQRSLLPGAPTNVPADVTATRCIPTDAVGGDIYDFHEAGDYRIRDADRGRDRARRAGGDAGINGEGGSVRGEQACSRPRGNAEFWTRVDRKDVVVAGASSDRQVPRVLAGVKARRCAPPPLSRGSRP